ncbi:hypothetical protein [Phenylobacterium sp.]|uniref:hypothetical protein n=1 Tax=Phenylobacterium sp. TaxID=1871053 RepID=UPI00301BDC8F
MRNDGVRFAVNLAILTAHRLGEPRVLELSPDQLRDLRDSADPVDWAPGVPDWAGGPGARYRDLRVAEAAGSVGRVLAWDRARETEMVQLIPW